jgi:hypothetical protein
VRPEVGAGRAAKGAAPQRCQAEGVGPLGGPDER